MHTKGPWNLMEPDETEQPTNALAGVFTNERFIATVWKSSHASPDGAMANANLIVAAPELLEALEGLQRELRQHIRFDVKKHYSLMVYDVAATKAIAKAHGIAAVGYTDEF